MTTKNDNEKQPENENIEQKHGSYGGNCSCGGKCGGNCKCKKEKEDGDLVGEKN